METDKLAIFAPTVAAWSWGMAMLTPKIFGLFGYELTLETTETTALTFVLAAMVTFVFNLTGYKPKEKI